MKANFDSFQFGTENVSEPERKEGEKHENRESRKKRKQREKRVGSSLISLEAGGKEGRKDEQSKLRPGALDELLANLTIKQREHAEAGHEKTPDEKAKKSEKTEKTHGAVASETIKTEASHAQLETDPDSSIAGTERVSDDVENNTEASKTYKELPDYKVEEGDLFEGELYIRDKKPVSERVILLQGEQPAEQESAEPEPDTAWQQSQVKAHEAVPEREPAQELKLDSEPDAEPIPPQAGGGEVPPVDPPERPRFEFAQPEEPERPMRQWFAPEATNRPEPAQVYREYMQREAARRTAQPEVTKEELDDAVYQATRIGQIKGVFAGIMAGGLYEHFKHKRREKKTKAKIEQLEAARRDYRFNLQNQEQQRTAVEARLGAAERRVTMAEKRLAEQQLTQTEAIAQLAAQQQSEQQSVVPPEQLVVPPEHRIQTSTWLSTEIDKKTGKVVERPTFQYGHEYYRERAQEAMPAQQRHAAAGGVVLTAASANGQSSTDDASLPSVHVPNATMQGSPAQLHTQQDADSTRSKSPVPPRSNTPLWPWIVALLVIAICLIVALR